MVPSFIIRIAIASLLSASVAFAGPIGGCGETIVWLSPSLRTADSLKQGDPAELSDARNDHPVLFVGRIKGTPEQGSQLVFVGRRDNVLHFLPEATTRIIGNRGKTVEGIEAAPIVQSAEQSGGTCATECLFNYVSQLRAMGQPPATLPKETGALWSMIYNLVSHENLGINRYGEEANALEIQRFNQHRFLRRSGVPYQFVAGEKGNVADPLVVHLQSGGYALLGYRTSKRYYPDTMVVDHAVSSRPGFPNTTASAPTGTGDSGHAVFASGFFPKGVRDEARVLIVDSAPGGKGSMYLWGQAELARLNLPHNDAFLVTGPGRKISSAESNRSWLPVPLNKKKRAAYVTGDESMVGYAVRAKYADKRGDPPKSIEGTIIEHTYGGGFTVLNAKGERIKVPAEDSGSIDSVDVQLGPASWQSHTGFVFGDSPLPDVAANSIAVMPIGYGEDQRILAGKIVKRDVAPGYAVYVITERNGTVHEVDPSKAFVGTLSIAHDAPGALDAFAPFEGKAPIRMIDEMKAAQGANIDWLAPESSGIPLPTEITYGRDTDAKTTEKLLSRVAKDKTPVTIRLPGMFLPGGGIGRDRLTDGIVIEHHGEFAFKPSNGSRMEPLDIDKKYGGHFTLTHTNPRSGPTFLDYLASHRPAPPIDPATEGKSWSETLETRLNSHKGKKITVFWTGKQNARRHSEGVVERVWMHEGIKYLRFANQGGDIPFDNVLRVEFPWSFFGQRD